MTIDNWGMLFAFILGVGAVAGTVAGLVIRAFDWWDDYAYGDEDDDEPAPLPEHTSDADPGPPEDDDPSWQRPRPDETEPEFLQRVTLDTPPRRGGDTLDSILGPTTIVGGTEELTEIDWPAVEDRPLLEVARQQGITDEVVVPTSDPPAILPPPPFTPRPPVDAPTRWVRTPRVLHLRGCGIARTRGEDVPVDTVQAAVTYAAEQRPPLRLCHACHPAAELTQGAPGGR